MDRLSIKELIKASGGTLIAGSEEGWIEGVSTDSRSAGAGDLFVPLIGEVHDAHKFIPQAAANGCRTFFVSKPEAAPKGSDTEDGPCNVILVKDTLKAMEALAKYYLDKIDVRRIAVTGSVGKTTTRDMMYYICSEKYKTGRPQKNFNNEIGVPLTIFSFDSSYEVAVFEEGMEKAGTIHEVTEITRPEAACITNVGVSHMENLGSRENIRAAKLEIRDFMGPDDVLVINEQSDYLDRESCSGPHRLVTVGESGQDYTVKDIIEHGGDGISFTLCHDGKEHEIRLNVPGRHNAFNAALAIAVCSKLDISIEEAARGLKKLEMTGRRLKFRKAGGVSIIDDSYNAAPDSVRAAIDILMAAEGGRKVAVLGDMFELGRSAPDLHAEIGRYAAEKGVDILVTCGSLSKNTAKAAGSCTNKAKQSLTCIHFDSTDDLLKGIKQIVRDGDTVLIKASNGMGLGRTADALCGE